MYEKKFDMCTKFKMYLTKICKEKFVRQWEQFTQISDETFIYALTRVMWKLKAISKISIDISGQFPVNKFTNICKGFIRKFFLLD